MNESQETDVALLQKIALGAEGAFDELYRRRGREVYRYAYAMSASKSIAEDVTQDVFLNVLQNASRFHAAKGAVRAWLIGCARHIVLDRMRERRRWIGEVDDEHAGTSAAGEEAVSQLERSAALHRAIVALPAQYREAVVLCELEELSYAEAAALLGCPIGTVRSRLHRGRTMLASRLGTAAGGEPLAPVLAKEVMP
jgi:RNA polymerase sigma-70 factor (ECF subfamily)